MKELIVLNENTIDKIIKYARNYDFTLKEPIFGCIVSHIFTSYTTLSVFEKIKEEEKEEKITNRDKIKISPLLKKISFNRKQKHLDLTNKEDLEFFYKNIKENFINGSFYEFFSTVINKPYKLMFLNFLLENNFLDSSKETKEKFAELIVKTYLYVELPYSNKEEVESLYEYIKDIDVQKYIKAPLKLKNEKIEIFRGQQQGVTPYLSWTTDIEVAKKFSTCIRSKGKGTILKTIISKDDIWFTTNDLDEFEIVLKPTVNFSKLNIIEDYKN